MSFETPAGAVRGRGRGGQRARSGDHAPSAAALAQTPFASNPRPALRAGISPNYLGRNPKANYVYTPRPAPAIAETSAPPAFPPTTTTSRPRQRQRRFSASATPTPTEFSRARGRSARVQKAAAAAAAAAVAGLPQPYIKTRAQKKRAQAMAQAQDGLVPFQALPQGVGMVPGSAPAPAVANPVFATPAPGGGGGRGQRLGTQTAFRTPFTGHELASAGPAPASGYVPGAFSAALQQRAVLDVGGDVAMPDAPAVALADSSDNPTVPLPEEIARVLAELDAAHYQLFETMLVGDVGAAGAVQVQELWATAEVWRLVARLAGGVRGYQDVARGLAEQLDRDELVLGDVKSAVRLLTHVAEC